MSRWRFRSRCRHGLLKPNFLGGSIGVGSSPLIHEHEENKELDHIRTKIVSYLLRSYSSNYFIQAIDRISLDV